MQSGGLHLCVNVAQRLSNNFSHIVKMSKFSLKGFKISEFWRSTLSNAIGAILGIILTFGTTFFIQRHTTAVHERDVALMVIHNIDKYCKFVDESLAEREKADSINGVILTTIFNEETPIADSTMTQFVANLYKRDFWAHDNTAENIFSNNIEIWRDIEDKFFLENVGQCFSAMTLIQKLYDEYDTMIMTAYVSYKKNVEFAQSDITTLRHFVQKIVEEDDTILLADMLHRYLPSLKAAVQEIKRRNTINKQLMRVTDEELDAIFREKPTDGE